jgi:hypothetical protein
MSSSTILLLTWWTCQAAPYQKPDLRNSQKNVNFEQPAEDQEEEEESEEILIHVHPGFTSS